MTIGRRTWCGPAPVVTPLGRAMAEWSAELRAQVQSGDLMEVGQFSPIDLDPRMAVREVMRRALWPSTDVLVLEHMLSVAVVLNTHVVYVPCWAMAAWDHPAALARLIDDPDLRDAVRTALLLNGTDEARAFLLGLIAP